MNNSNSFGLVRGSESRPNTNKRYVLSQLITRRIGIDDITKRKDISDKFKNGISNLNDKYIKDVISNNNGTDKKFKVCQSCLSHKKCKNYNSNNYKNYIYDNKEFVVCYVNVDDQEYYFHIDVILDNNILKYTPFVIIKTDLKLSPEEKDLKLSPEEKDLKLAPEEKDLKFSPEEKDLKLAPEEKDLKLSPEEKSISNLKQDIIIEKSNIVIIDKQKKIIVEKFEKIEDDIVEATIIEIDLIKDKRPELSENQIRAKFKRDFKDLKEINEELTYWFEMLEKYPEYSKIIDNYLYYLIEEKEIFKVLGSINRHRNISKRIYQVSKTHSNFDKEMQERISNAISLTPAHLYRFS